MELETLTTTQMMEILQYKNRGKFLENMQAGRIPMGAKVGGEWRWSRAFIQKWIADGMPKQSPEDTEKGGCRHDTSRDMG